MFGDRLKKILERENFTQTKLAKLLNISGPAVNRWCNNITEPDTVTIGKIADILNISTDELLGKKTKNINVAESNKEILENIAEDMNNPLSKAIYSKASELKTDKDRQIVLNIIEGFIKGIDENK